MNRNLRNELLTAIFVIVGILIAIGAIIALSSSSNIDVPSLTPTMISMVEALVDDRTTASIADMTAQITSIDVNVTEMAISTIMPSVEPVGEITKIASTISIVVTYTTMPTRTAISATPTKLPSHTPVSPTRTPHLTNIPPSATFIPSTATPMATRTNIPTDTPHPATQTPVPSHTPVLSSTPILSFVTPTSTPMITDVLVAEGCLNPSIQITSPRPNDRLSAPFDVIGTATLPNFGVYRIEIRPHNALTYQRIKALQQVIYADVLAQIDPSNYPNGIYWIRLIVLDNRGVIAENGTCAIPTIFE